MAHAVRSAGNHGMLSEARGDWCRMSGVTGCWPNSANGIENKNKMKHATSTRHRRRGRQHFDRLR